MFDQDMLDQLKAVFQKLENPVELAYDFSNHEKQAELVEMLSAVASTSENIHLSQSEKSSPVPHFRIRYNGKENGILFTGIPGGHEFTSLILAILNSDGKGKLPDEGILKRVQRLKGPIKLRTFISLSCENCPEVIQALNIMAIYHPELSHQMTDGEFAAEDIEKLKIQGVPAVVSEDGTLISSGKVALVDLIKKLEDHYGIEESANQDAPKDLGSFDVVVIGGGPAGASSAIYSARKGLKTVIIAERFGGQVQDTKGIENLISVPYTEGPQLSAQLASHVAQYDVKILEHRRVLNVNDGVTGNGAVKTLKLDTGETLTTKSLIVATGAKWRELNVPGEKEYLGRGVAFCPHCDGPFYKGKDIAVIGGGNSGVEAAIDLAGIVKSVTLIEFGADFKADKVLVDKMNSLPNVKGITNAKTTQVVGDGAKVNALEYEDRLTGETHRLLLDGVFVQIGLVPNSQFLRGVVEMNKFGEILVDEKGRTNVPGIYAAGDVTTTPYKQIVVALGEGAKAALAAFEDQMLHGA